MQPVVGPPRDSLTVDDVTGLLRDDPSVTFSAGMEVLNDDLTVQSDISDDLEDGTVERHAYATLHGTLKFSTVAELDWGRAIVRPYMTLTGSTITARFNLGAYFTDTPSRVVEVRPMTYTVRGFDILSRLDDPVGETYGIGVGELYLAAVEQILIERGVDAYTIDQTAAASVLPTGKVWALDNRTTWLNVVNDLLGAIGYLGVFSDWDGRLRVQPYQPPLARPVEWTYNVTLAESMIGPHREYSRDFTDTPNRWVFWRGNNVDSTTPVEGDGLYTFVNQSTGETSVDARGRVITRAESLDVADHPALLLAAQQKIDADMRVSATLELATFPNPLHWHFDRVYINDPYLGRPPVEGLGTSWTLDLLGADMRHEFTVLN